MCLGVPGKIIKIYEEAGLLMGTIDFSGVQRAVCLAYTPEAKVGDYALVHVGFALNLLSEAEAIESLNLFQEIAEADAVHQNGSSSIRRPAAKTQDEI
jgi:hydrogenase expression/formation protein HypC